MTVAGGVFKTLQGAAGAAVQAPVRGGMGLIGVAGTAFGMYSSMTMYSDKYGAGGAAAIGLGEAALFTVLPFTTGLLAAGAIYGLPALADYGQDVYKRSRRLNMGQPMHDPFGTMATMRQRSAQTLQRGRAVLGSEARLYHY